MPDAPLRILLLADTHLGFDEARRPRVERRRRGPDFWANYHRALEPARRGEVDLVVHAGDLLYRSRVRASLVDRALQPLRELADGGVPVVLAFGNHERSHLPFPLLGIHTGLHLLDHPRTVELDVRGTKVAVSGFPCQRDRVEDRFLSLLAQTGCHDSSARVRLLCLHQTVEGARVGPRGFVFRPAPDVVRGRDLPAGFAAVLAGHIHRHQVLEHDLAGRPLASPVLYPGSIERTSFAERHEQKGYLTLDVEPTSDGGRLRRHVFHPLPARPMVTLELDLEEHQPAALVRHLSRWLARLDPDSVVRIRLASERPRGKALPITAAKLRDLAPASMTIDLRVGARSAPTRPTSSRPSRRSLR